jgi:uncharacterized protein (DUF302 family)
MLEAPKRLSSFPRIHMYYLLAIRVEALSEVKFMTATPASGIITAPTNHSVDETVRKLEGILREKGITLFTLVDHSGEAEKAGLKMPPTKLLIFGNPKAGTPVMLAAPSIAIDLPLKVLVWQDNAGKTWLSYNSPEYLKNRHGVPDDLVKNIAGVGALVEAAAI